MWQLLFGFLVLFSSEAPAERLDTENMRMLEAEQKVVVLLFLNVDCPIANSYAPTMNELASSYPEAAFIRVYSDPQLTEDQIKEHAKQYKLELRPIHDSHQQLARGCGASVTPEAVVLVEDGLIAYRGRIDDRYPALGVHRQSASTHDLEDAISAVMSGKPVARPRMEAVGCFIEFKEESER